MCVPLLCCCLADALGFAGLANDSGGVWWISRTNTSDSPPELSLSLGITAMRYFDFLDSVTGISRYKQANDLRFGGNHSAWADASLSLLMRLGFNTVGTWSDTSANEAANRSGALYTPIVPFGCYNGTFPDVFSPAFAANAKEIAAKQIAPLLGWYSDNELLWWKNYEEETQQAMGIKTRSTNLLWQFLTQLPRGSAGQLEATMFLRSKLPSHHPALPLLVAEKTEAETQPPKKGNMDEQQTNCYCGR